MQDSSEHDRRVLSLNGQSAFPKFAFFSWHRCSYSTGL
jgi:hypothetical protein